MEEDTETTEDQDAGIRWMYRRTDGRGGWTWEVLVDDNVVDWGIEPELSNFDEAVQDALTSLIAYHSGVAPEHIDNVPSIGSEYLGLWNDLNDGGCGWSLVNRRGDEIAADDGFSSLQEARDAAYEYNGITEEAEPA